VWTDLVSTDPELSDLVRPAVGAMSDALARQIRASGNDGVIDPDLAGMAVLAMLDRFHFLREYFGQPVDQQALDTLSALVHRALFGLDAPE
jgi:hypothetical protein